ncbi:hypothetical protein N9X38_03390 [Gammaproteobacteria bacterium]|nr:hypothetical protein [Gammaproteobacteria bacterium]
MIIKPEDRTFEDMQWLICFQVGCSIASYESENHQEPNDAFMDHFCRTALLSYKGKITDEIFRAVEIGGIAMASSKRGKEMIKRKVSNKHIFTIEDTIEVKSIITEFMKEFYNSKKITT